MSKKRPAGVILISMIRLAIGLLELLGGGLLLAGGGLLGSAALGLAEQAPRLAGSLVGVVVVSLGVTLLLFALLDFVLAWGMWTLQRWAWWTALVDALLGTLCPAASLLSGNPGGVLPLVFNGSTIGLLLMPEVMQAMGVRLA